jgi:hypothetical protein
MIVVLAAMARGMRRREEADLTVVMVTMGKQARKEGTRPRYVWLSQNLPEEQSRFAPGAAMERPVKMVATVQPVAMASKGDAQYRGSHSAADLVPVMAGTAETADARGAAATVETAATAAQ